MFPMNMPSEYTQVWKDFSDWKCSSLVMFMLMIAGKGRDGPRSKMVSTRTRWMTVRRNVAVFVLVIPMSTGN